MYPDLPFEFLVYGTAVSQQAKLSASRDEWKERVVLAARDALPQNNFLLNDPLAVIIYFFPQAEMRGDLDNCAKPLLDAMSDVVYMDDRLIDRLVVQKFEPQRPLIVSGATTDRLATALAADQPIVYIKVADDLRGE